MRYQAPHYILTSPRFFIPCGTMFPRNLPSAGDMAARWALDEIAMRPSRGRGVHRTINETHARNGYLSEAIDGISGNTWLHQ